MPWPSLPCAIDAVSCRPRHQRPSHNRRRQGPRPPARNQARGSGASCLQRPSRWVYAVKCRAGQKSFRHPPSNCYGGGCHTPRRSARHGQTGCRQSAAQTLWLVVVDASASTRRHQALSDAKGLLAQLFEDAYRQRARVAVMKASGSSPVWQVSGQKASAALNDWLEQLGAGGGTPLLQALEEVSTWLAMRRKRFPQEQQRFLLVTDGRLKAWSALPAIDCPGLLIDIERGPIRLGRAPQLAADLNADYLHIDG